MKIEILTYSMIALVSFAANDGTYRLNEEKIDRAFEHSKYVELSLILRDQKAFEAAVAASEDEKQMIAGIVALASFIGRVAAFPIAYFPLIGTPVALGLCISSIVPWHRLVILGTGGEGALKITALHCVTLGWCINAHHIVDGVFLLIEEDKSRFVDNSKYVMWAN